MPPAAQDEPEDPKVDPDRKLFADELKAIRKQRGWTQAETAARIRFSESTIANIESMRRAPTRDQAVLLDEAFQTSGTFVRLERRLRGVPFSAGFRPFQLYEAEARVLRMFEHTLVPGLFQTEDYARANLEIHPEVTEQDVRDRIEARMARQAILLRKEPTPPRIWAVLDEHVLTMDMGSPAVMAGQVAHLAELARMPRINIQVIRAGRFHPGHRGAYSIAEMDHPPTIVYLENAHEGQTVEDPDTAESMALMFDALRMEALTGSASLKLIEEAAQRWKEQAET